MSPDKAPVPRTMQAVTANGRGLDNVRVAEVPVPEPGPDQLLARVDAAGVCTSILKLVDQAEEHAYLNGWDISRWPIILGDEGAITLVQVGANLTDRYRPGQRFAIQPAVDTAPIVHRERYRDQARHMRKCAVGYTLQGHLAQYILVQEEVLAGQCLLPLPADDLPHYAVSMAEPISCIVSAQERHVHIRRPSPHEPRVADLGLLKDGVTVVCGAGAMGRMHAELALRFSPAVLIVVDLQKPRLDRVAETLETPARDRGCRLICVLPEALEATLRDVGAQRGGADDFILAVGVREVQQQALGLLADGGVANLFGGLPKGKHTLELNALDVHYREIRVVGSSGGGAGDLAGALQAIARRHIDPGNYVAGVGSLDNAPDVLRMIENAEIEGKAILYPHIRPTPLRRVHAWSPEAEADFLRERAP